MFLGTTTAPVRNFMARELTKLMPVRVLEPFAGIFMVSQICGKISKSITVESTDVSLFSSLIGDGLCWQQSTRLRESSKAIRDSQKHSRASKSTSSSTTHTPIPDSTSPTPENPYERGHAQIMNLGSFPPAALIQDPYGSTKRGDGRAIASAVHSSPDPYGLQNYDMSSEMELGYQNTSRKQQAAPYLTEQAVRLVPYWEGRNSPEDLACAAIYFLEYAVAYKKRETAYYGRLLKDLTNNAERYHKDIRTKFLKLKEALGDFRFRALDACILLQEIQQGDVVFYDPPFWQGGYEKMFAELPNYLSRDPVPYTEIDDDMKDRQLQQMHEQGALVYYRDNREREIPNFTMRFKAEYKYNSHFYIYSNHVDENLLQRNNRIRENPKTRFPLFWKDDVISNQSKVSLIQCDGKTANHYRLLWNKKAEMRDMGGSSYLLAIDGKVAGVLIMATGMQFGHNFGIIVADTTTPYSKYKRLSKLTLKLALTREFADTLERKFRWPVDGFTTAVYSNKNYSSKYRGLMEKIKTEEMPVGPRYKLIYQTSEVRVPTLRAAFKEWLQKYGNDIKDMSYERIGQDD